MVRHPGASAAAEGGEAKFLRTHQFDPGAFFAKETSGQTRKFRT
jgi:hypothetical protein